MVRALGGDVKGGAITKVRIVQANAGVQEGPLGSKDGAGFKRGLWKISGATTPSGGGRNSPVQKKK